MCHIRRFFTVLLFILFFSVNCSPSYALVDLVTLPKRDNVQITIYNSSDLTLVKESRTLSLEKGMNKLEFSWVNTLIDPTSIFFKSLQPGVELINLSFPPRIKGAAIWNIKSNETKPTPVEISYFTSGLTWESYYLCTLNKDETAIGLAGYVKVRNGSGEDYENAETRLIVGKISLLDRIAELAGRTAPYGDPRGGRKHDLGAMLMKDECMEEKMSYQRKAKRMVASMELAAPKKIIKEGLSEYFLFTIEGTETIKNGWQKRLPSFNADTVPIKNLFKFDPHRYGNRVNRFLYFKNDKKHNLGETPLPGGMIKVFQTIDNEDHLKYLGEDHSKYIPVNQEVEIDLGPTEGVTIEPNMMNFKTKNFTFDHRGNIWGYTDQEDWNIKINNFRDYPSKIKIRKHLKHQYWKIKMNTKKIKYKKIDLRTIEFTIDLKAGANLDISFEIDYFEGKNKEGK